ncbi:unnamed protein product [Mesocestoides corti]|uniref:Uncharacterized protein n=1 Tax=Mesocestoides corti TaxID=53468 RepID=A0A0R3UA65_MESCO|nr:unnamed protein product [Mesocestoides corti]
MSEETSPRSSQVAASQRNAFRDYVVAYKLSQNPLKPLIFEDILGEKTDVNLNFQVPSRCDCLVTFFNGFTGHNGELLEFLSGSESDDSELGEFTWKPLRKMTAGREKRLLVLRRRL